MDLISKLADNGVVATLLAISLLVNWNLAKMLLAEKDKRIDGAEKVRNELIAPIGFIKESLDLIQEKIRISKDRA